MIPMKDIRKALSDLIKASFPGWLLTYNNSPDVEQDYIYIELLERRRTVDPVYYDRDIEVDIRVIPLPDVRGNVKRSKLYDARTHWSRFFCQSSRSTAGPSRYRRQAVASWMRCCISPSICALRITRQSRRSPS